MIRIAMLTTNPARGPAHPTSKMTLREGMGDFNLMTAPRVPKGKMPRNEGNGIKYGSVDFMPWIRAAK